MSDDLDEYLAENKVQDFIASLTESICQERPTDLDKFVLEFVQKRLKEKGEEVEDTKEKEKSDEELDEDYKNSVAQFQKENKEKNRELEKRVKEEEGNSTEIDTSTSESIRNSYIFQVRRKAFSSESINMDDIQNYTPQKVEKTEEERSRLSTSLAKIALFSHFEKDDLEVLYDAMFPVVCSKGDVIIRQGDVGDNFYVIDSGICEIFVKFEKDKDDVLVKTCKEGDSFGELALMYGTPRAATIKAAIETKLWALDRMSYRKIMMGRTLNKRELYEGFLKKVPLFKSLNDYERLTIADALIQQEFKEGEDIIRQGETGFSFFIITEGQCQVWKSVDGKRVDLVTLKRGDYFGELALLFDQPRAATVTAKTSTKTVSLDVKSFKLLLGPVDEILKRNTENYEFYMAKQIPKENK